MKEKKEREREIFCFWPEEELARSQSCLFYSITSIHITSVNTFLVMRLLKKACRVQLKESDGIFNKCNVFSSVTT